MKSPQPTICLSASSLISFLFYGLGITCLTSATVYASYGGNEMALLSFKSRITHDPYKVLTSWNHSFQFCNWSGISCGKRHKRVTAVQLFSFQGTIPHELGRLSSLGGLGLHINKFTGVIPTNLSHCYNLEDLWLALNNLAGSIPKEMSLLSKLSRLVIRESKLTGGISHFLWNITTMEWFDASGNQFGGSIPDTLDICNQLPNLEFLQLWGNELTGVLPPSLSNCSKLGYLEMSDNNFGGKLTIDFSNLRDIYIIKLHSYNFHGCGDANDMTFIDSLKNCTRLITLNHYNCSLTGVLPISIGNLSHRLSILALGDNHLFGSLPSSIGSLVGLTALELKHNRFKGKIPTTIGKLQKLQYLDLASNQFSGTIPYAIRNLSLSTELCLDSNKLEGHIPSSLGNCKELNKLNFSHNRLSGNVPKQLLQLPLLSNFLDLSYNRMSGSIPSEIKDLKMLSYLDLSYNNLSGTITSSLGECISLTMLNLRGHIFQGIIPSSLSSLRGLRVLDISQNKLSGKIPQFLDKWNSLEFLNLSFNDFEGEVPVVGVFANTSAFWILGNNKLCGGLVTLDSVYKEILDSDDDRCVAIKVLHLHNRGAHKSFLAECEAWQNIRHRNVLKTITSCSSVDFQGNDLKAMVYEFMSNGSVHDWLHSSTFNSKLNLLQRINILRDVATALDYLQNRCQTTIVHGDLKPSNVTLDDDMVAHVGDFGLARLLGAYLNQSSSAGVKGTIGYAPLEYGIGSEMTSCGDIYSFGILLLEVMTGKKPTDNMFSEGLSLHKFAYMALPDHVIDVIDNDAIVMQSTEANARKVEECLAATIKIGVSCSVDSPPQRMKIEIVIHEV
ncbi:kinase-like domain-containing protein [Tanacetum coccineum]|uniref:Kinase-like domain-containing protein n=1 Tax=Tanacetum coccineum TaxID=301880 RepID=A0ABQ4WZI6_9ASTR